MVQHTYLGNFPKERQDDWTDECQGITHHDAYWLITQKEAVWRIPVWKDLRTPMLPGDDGVLRRGIPISGYDHFGDPDVHDGRLYIPLEGKHRILWFSWDKTPRMAVFDAFDLTYLWSVELTLQQKAGWCAIDSNGVLYTSNSRMTGRVESKKGPLFRYQIEDRGLRYLGRTVLDDEHGDPVDFDSMQGGTFADDQHLYISCGFYKGWHESWGIHLFDLRTRRRIARSTNGSGDFNYEFHPFPYEEEPEGLTYWDLDLPRAPGISGQLHAILLDNDDNGDDVYLKHYRVEGL